MMTFPTEWKNKSHVPNQPVLVFQRSRWCGGQLVVVDSAFFERIRRVNHSFSRRVKWLLPKMKRTLTLCKCTPYHPVINCQQTYWNIWSRKHLLWPSGCAPKVHQQSGEGTAEGVARALAFMAFWNMAHASKGWLNSSWNYKVVPPSYKLVYKPH